MGDPTTTETDPAVAAALFGSAPLRSIAHQFETRGEWMRFCADVLDQAHPPYSGGRCKTCDGGDPVMGTYVLEWRGTVKMYWVRILLFSTAFLPVVMVALLLPFAIIAGPNIRIGEFVEFRTWHPLCRSCWRRCRLRQAAAFLTTLIAGFILAVSFIAAAIAGSLAIACWVGAWGYKPREAHDPALVFLGTAALCIGAKWTLHRVPRRFLTPPSLRRSVKGPFHLADAKLVRFGAVAPPVAP